jgi:hypothetical protein
VILTKGGKRILKQDLKEDDLHWKGGVGSPRLGGLLDVLCTDSGDPGSGNLRLDGLECWRFHLE